MPAVRLVRSSSEGWWPTDSRVHWGLCGTLVAVGFIGCEEAASRYIGDVEDSAGVSIVMSDATDTDATCSLADAPTTRVASPRSGEWTIFEIEDLDRLGDGRLVVVNRSSRELLMFSRDGEFLRAIGRRGEGPGEFVDPVELGVIDGDSIVVWDWGSGRLVLFGPDGSHGRTVRLQPPVINPTGHMGMLGRQGIAIGSHDLRPFQTQLTPQFLQVLRYSWSGTLLDTLVTLPYGERKLVDLETNMMGNPHFESRGVFSTHRDLLYTSDGSSPEVQVLREGRLESIIRWDPGDLSVRDEDVEAYRAAWLEGAANTAPLIRKRLDAFPFNDAFPAVMEIQIDPESRMWIRTFARPGSTGTVWLGFEEKGSFICNLFVPTDLRVFRFASTMVVGVHRNSMDVESIHVTPFGLPR